MDLNDFIFNRISNSSSSGFGRDGCVNAAEFGWTFISSALQKKWVHRVEMCRENAAGIILNDKVEKTTLKNYNNSF